MDYIARTRQPEVSRQIVRRFGFWMGVCVLLCGAIGFLMEGCGGTQCGPGTILQNGLCVPATQDSGATELSKESSPDLVAENGGGTDVNIPPEVLKENDLGDVSTSDTPGGLAKTGEACDAQRPCEKGPCLQDGYCSAPCSTNEQCPVGMECREINYKQPDGTWKTLVGCVRPPDSPKTCQRDQDCPAQQSCVTSLSAGGDAVVQVCANSIPGGKAPGEECNATEGLQCRNALCINDAFCSALCVTAADCPANWVCDDVTTSLPGGKQAKIKACTLGQKVCERDQDCPNGTICRSFLSQDQTKLDFFCAPSNRSGAKAGEACDGTSAQTGCYNYLCADAGFCLAICKTDGDCREGFSCTQIEASLPKGKFKFRSCVLKPVPCERDKDCPTGLICTLATNEAQDQLTPVCNIRRLRSQAAGETCVSGSDKPNENCSTNMCLSDNYCSALCKDDTDCPANFLCTSLSVALPNNPNATITGCIKQNP